MLSLFGSLLILSGGLLAWQCHHADRQRRRDTLNDCVTALEHISEEIRMARTPLPQLMEKLARDCRPDAAALFQKAAKAARQGEALSPPQAARERAIARERNHAASFFVFIFHSPLTLI